MAKRKKITIDCEMEERWIPTFLSMLRHMEYLGNVGSSRNIAFYADGDGDFRPKFKHNVEYENVMRKDDYNKCKITYPDNGHGEYTCNIEYVFDAG